MPTTAIEKAWPSVPPQPLTADGTQHGVVSVANSRGFKVKQKVVLVATGLPNLEVKIMRFLSPTQFYVGPLNPTAGQGLTGRADISAYTVALGAYVYAAEQPKVTIKPDDIIQAVYRQEPGTTIGVELDDEWGNPYNSDNPLPIAFDGTIAVGEVEIKGSPSGYLVDVNADGSINVNIVSTPVAGQNIRSIYNEVASVASGVETQIVSYTVPIGKSAVLQRINTSGENVGRYKVYLNGVPFDIQRTYYGGDMNALFEYTGGGPDGYLLNATDVISVKILHTRIYVGNFNARIQVLEIT